MLKSVASCGVAWDNYYNTMLSRSGRDCGGASGSGSGQSAQMSRPSKRLITAVDPPAANRPSDRQPVGGAARQAFDPFVSIHD
jgi:hypothetical protein